MEPSHFFNLQFEIQPSLNQRTDDRYFTFTEGYFNLRRHLDRRKIMNKTYFQYQIVTLFSIAIIMSLIFSAQPVIASSTKQSEIKPVVDVLVRKSELSKISAQERRRICSNNFASVALDRQATISGPIQRQRSNVQMAGHSLYQLVESYYYGDEYAGASIRDALSEAVQIDAFTDVKAYHPKEHRSYNGLNEPYFQLAVFLTPLAHAYLVLKAEFPNETQFHQKVRQWGDKLYSITISGKNDFKGKVMGVDRRALHAMGYAHWGNATGNPKILETAYKYYKKAMLCVGKGGKDRIWKYWAKKKDLIYYPNMTYQAAFGAAFALRRSGYDNVYELAPKKGTIVDGMEWLWDSVFDKDQFQLMLIQGSGSRTVAWAEIYMREFPDRNYTNKMRSWIESKKTPVYGAYAGGPVSCLYRAIN